MLFKVLVPPMPPCKEAKPCAVPFEEAPEEAKAEKKTGPPPTPPNKPSSSSSTGNLAEAPQTRPNSHPPTPPSKEHKPSHPAVEPDQEVQGTAEENEEKEEVDKEEAVETDEADRSISKEAVPSVRDDEPESPSDRSQGQVSEEESEESVSSGINEASGNEPLRKSPSPLLTAKKKPEKAVQPDTQHADDSTTITQTNEGQDPAALPQTASRTSASSPPAEEAPPKSEVPPIVVSPNDPVNDSLSLSPLLSHLPGDKKKKTEEKSVDSGQHSDADSEGSGSEDTLAASTAALRGSKAGLDVLDTREGNIQIPVSLRLTQTRAKPQVRPKVFPHRRSQPPTPALKPSIKVRSASIGDLLSDSPVCIQASPHTRAGAGDGGAPRDDVMELETEVALEMEKTRELLSRVSQSQGGGGGEGMPEDLLVKAMEKLKTADHVLREVNKLKLAKSPSIRKSW